MGVRGVVCRFAVLLAVVGVVLVVAAVGGAVSDYSTAGAPDEPPEQPAYAVDRIVTDPIPAGGSVLERLEAHPANGSNKRVVINLRHTDRLEREDFQPLVGGLVRSGHEVRFVEQGDDLRGPLDVADAYVVIDPSEGHDGPAADRVETFVARGGRLLLVGEPNRVDVDPLLGAVLGEQRSELDHLAGRFGFTFGTRYLHNMDRNDGNYQRVIAEPTDGADLPGVDRAVLNVGAPVYAEDGEDLLLTAPGTKVAGVDEGDRYPVMIRDDGVMAIGDASLFGADEVQVGDNEAVVAETIRFLVGGDKEPRVPPTPSPTPTTSPTPLEAEDDPTDGLADNGTPTEHS